MKKNDSNYSDNEESIISEEEISDPEMIIAKEEEEEYIMKYHSEGEDDEEDKSESKRKPALLRAAKKPTFNLDPSFNLESNYFYQNLQQNEITEIKQYFTETISLNKIPTEIELDQFFNKYPNIKKGNADKILKL